MPYYRLISSSGADLLNMSQAFPKTYRSNIWITGLPRNDFLLCPLCKLPGVYQKQYSKLKGVIGDERLIVYAPTYRETQVGGEYYQFSEFELLSLRDFCTTNGVLFGVRYHLYRRPASLNNLLKQDFVLDLSSDRYFDFRTVLRACSLLITDYSSVCVDAGYARVPSVSFAYDFDHYMSVQRGFFFELDKVFSGALSKDFQTLLVCIQELLGAKYKANDWLDNTLFEYRDCANSQRVVEEILKETLGEVGAG